MTDRIELSWSEVKKFADDVAAKLLEEYKGTSTIALYGVPRGGIFAAQSVAASIYAADEKMSVLMVDTPEESDAVIDDIVDSGATRFRYKSIHFTKQFFSLVDKQSKPFPWYSFPWERMTNETSGVEDNITRILQHIGEDPKRDGLKETPSRVVRSYQELYSGYKVDPSSVFKVFEVPCDEMVLVKNVEFYSMCEHHMLPFFGKAHIAYIPSQRVIGVSKLARLLEIYSRRLQVQERLCQQITKALDDNLKPLGSACILEAKHLCMTCRGVNKQNSTMVTSSLTGSFKDIGSGSARQELMQLIK